MIISLLYVGLLCMGVGAKASTPINLNRQETTKKQQRQLNEENEYTQTFSSSFAMVTPAHQTVLNTDAFTPANYTPTPNYPAQYVSYKYNLNQETTAFGIRGNIYDQNLIVGNMDLQSYQVGIAIPYQQQTTGETTSFHIYQITPYGWPENTTFTINLGVTCRVHNWVADNFNDTINFDYKVLNSTQESWNKFLNIQNYYTYTNNQNMYWELTNGTLGTNYNMQQKSVSHVIPDAGTPQSYDFSESFNIEIIANKTNYIVVYNVPTRVENSSNAYCVLATGNDNGSELNLFTGGDRTQHLDRSITLSGSYLMPPSNYEVVDIPGMMWEILAMPFAFISTAFNLTLFPNTPYQVNISNLVLMVFGVMVFIFIFKLILKK